MFLAPTHTCFACVAGQRDEWFFLFVILDRLSHQAIHLGNWSEIPRPPLDAETETSSLAPVDVSPQCRDRCSAKGTVSGLTNF
jgi:hypothetical protein